MTQAESLDRARAAGAEMADHGRMNAETMNAIITAKKEAADKIKAALDAYADHFASDLPTSAILIHYEKGQPDNRYYSGLVYYSPKYKRLSRALISRWSPITFTYDPTKGEVPNYPEQMYVDTTSCNSDDYLRYGYSAMDAMSQIVSNTQLARRDFSRPVRA